MAHEDAKTQVDTAFTRQGLRGLAFECLLRRDIVPAPHL